VLLYRAGKRIAQLCFQRYPSPVHVGGGDVRHWQDLRSLSALGHEVHVLACDPANELTDRAQQVAAGIHTLRSERFSRWNPRSWIDRGFNLETLALALPDLRRLRTQVLAVLDELQPDLIWADLFRDAIYHYEHDEALLLKLVSAIQQTSKRGFMRNPSSFEEVLEPQNVREIADALAWGLDLQESSPH